MKKIYLLHHEQDMKYFKKNKAYWNAEFIGAFFSKKEAKKMIKELKKKPGFRDYPKGFIVSKVKIDKIYFTKGF